MTSRISSSIDHTENRLGKAETNGPEKVPDCGSPAPGPVSVYRAGFFARQRELAKRRLWPIALTFVIHLLYHVVGTITALNGVLSEAARSHMSTAERTASLHDVIRGLLGIDSFSWMFITLPLAAILAIEGFAWLDDRRKVDFYESLPVPRSQRFLDICTGSFLYYFFSYAITLEMGLAAAGAMGALNRTVLTEILQQSLVTVAFFIAVYAVGVLSVMLTGNVIIAWLAFFVLLFYEISFRALMEGYGSVFLATWSRESAAAVYPLYKTLTSPVYVLMDNGSFLAKLLWLLGLGVFFLVLSWICCRLRRNELAGSAVIFGPVRSVVRIAVAVLIGLFTGLLFSPDGLIGGTVLSLVWVVLLTVITACVMQIIYEYDFRALFHRPAEILIALAVTFLVYAVFFFDLTGYDRFIPDPARVADAALISLDEGGQVCTDEGEAVSIDEFGGVYMHLTNVDDVIAVARYGQEYTRKFKALRGEEAPVIIAPAAAEAAGSEPKVLPGGEEFRFRVLFRMKNGKTVSRHFSLPASISPDIMDRITGTEAYREGAFFLYHDRAIQGSPGSLVLELTNGRDGDSRVLTAEEYRAFSAAYQADLAQFSYSFARQNSPILRLTFSETDSGISRITSGPENLYATLPVYPSFEHTCRVLQSLGIWQEPLDPASLPDPDNYNRLSRSDRELLDSLDLSVFTGPFHHTFGQ